MMAPSLPGRTTFLHRWAGSHDVAVTHRPSSPALRLEPCSLSNRRQRAASLN